jgi:diaminohydroxyphosphoribosylaminopyrimidine deaminase/5-amino-6-(5-phosphoribosylamino)uracil reductase
VNISNDLEGMTLALEWAAKGLYTTSPNPRIGCVIVRDGVVIGAGVTQQAGQRPCRNPGAADAQARGTMCAAPPPT